jgi:phage gp29-like protein
MAKVPQGEFAETSGGRDITRGFINEELLQAQDPLLLLKGGDYRAYEQVRSDDQVKAVLEQRRLAVVSCEWEVLPGGTSAQDKMAAEFLTEQLKNIRWDAVTDRMLNGVFYGFGVAECLYARDGARVVLDNVKVRKQRRFRFDARGRLKLLTMQSPLGELVPERKFWTFATGADNDDEPYGLGLAHWLYWPVYFKRNGIKFWLMFLEKLGGPTAIGKYPSGAGPDEKKKLLTALASIQTDSAIIIPEGMTAELLEATRSATPDYATLLDKMNAAISKVVVGQTMTTDDGSSQSQAEVHMDVRQDLVKADADLINESFNMGPARWLTEWNFPGAKVPSVWRRIEDEPDLKPQAERDKLIYDMGFKPTLAYINETYGGDWVEDKSPRPVAGALPPGAAPTVPGETEEEDAAQGDAALAEPGAAATRDAFDDLVAEAIERDGWEKVMKPIVAPIADRLDRAKSLEEFRDALAEILVDMDSAALTELLARAMFTSRLAGEVAADIGGADEAGK